MICLFNSISAQLLLNFHLYIPQPHPNGFGICRRDSLHQPAGNDIVILREHHRLPIQPFLQLLPAGRLEGLPIRFLLTEADLLQKILLFLWQRLELVVQLRVVHILPAPCLIP